MNLRRLGADLLAASEILSAMGALLQSTEPEDEPERDASSTHHTVAICDACGAVGKVPFLVSPRLDCWRSDPPGWFTCRNEHACSLACLRTLFGRSVPAPPPAAPHPEPPPIAPANARPHPAPRDASAFRTCDGCGVRESRELAVEPFVGVDFQDRRVGDPFWLCETCGPKAGTFGGLGSVASVRRARRGLDGVLA